MVIWYFSLKKIEFILRKNTNSIYFFNKHIYLRTYLHTYLRTYLRTCLCICLRLIYVLIYILIYVLIYVFVYVLIHICLHLIYLDNNCFTINDDITSPAHEGTKEILPFIL